MRPLLVSLAPALLLGGCGADSGACPGGSDEVQPIGYHFTYVVERAVMPASSAQASELGLDLDGDGRLDNRLGSLFAALAGQGVDVQGAMTAAIDRGHLILLLDLSMGGRVSFACADRVGLAVSLGDEAQVMPLPCAGTGDAVCRRHLDGTGSFGRATGWPDHLPIVGSLRDGDFDGGSGDLSLELALGSSESVRLDLIGVRAQATGIAEARIESILLAGSLPEERLVPMVHGLLAPITRADCPRTTPPDCGCAAGSTGRTVLGLFDTSPRDCAVTIEEMQRNTTVFRDPGDVSIDGTRAYSFGMEVSAVKGAIR
jgi:hypothetical protein